MNNKWERRKILIWGKTRPELSTKYRETVCTGGVFADTKRLVRLYPIPLRYMDDEKVFEKYQWIEAFVTKSTSDPRPESYKISADEIHVLDSIPTNSGDWGKRAEWVMQPENIFQSVEALQERQQVDRTSLGLIKPLKITNISATPVNPKEQADFWKRYQDSLQQMELPLEKDDQHSVKPLRPADFKFKIQFRCNDHRCQVDHSFSVLDWEIDALYFGCRRRGDTQQIARDKVIQKLIHEVCSDDKDLHFYLGNIFNHQHLFTIVGLWWPKKKENEQLSLFENV